MVLVLGYFKTKGLQSFGASEPSLQMNEVRVNLSVHRCDHCTLELCCEESHIDICTAHLRLWCQDAPVSQNLVVFRSYTEGNVHITQKCRAV